MARRRRRLVVIGGLVGLALSPAAAGSRAALRARIERFRRHGTDPVSPFLDAPCHGAAEGTATGDASHESEVVS